MKRLGIVAKTDREEARTVVPQLLKWCADRGIQPVLEKETAALCPEATVPMAGRPELPAQSDLLLVLGGALSCFEGYRLFKIVLGIYGFVLGAMLASSAMGATNTTGMIAAALVGGVCGAALLMFAYFIGIGLVGAGLGALVAHVAWSGIQHGDPPAVAVIVLSILGSIGAMFLQRYVIIVATAFGGAWTMIVGAMALVGNRAALKAATSGDVWVAYPLNPAPGQRWVVIVWIVLSLIGAGVQLGITGGEKGRVLKRRKTD